MRTSNLLVLACCLSAAGGNLSGQAAAEAGAAAAASTAGAAAGTKGAAKSIGGALDKLGRQLDKASGGKTDEKPAATPPQAASSTVVKMPASPAPAKVETARLVKPSQIRVGMTREELLKSVGKPSVRTSGADEGEFSETYYYDGAVDTVCVTLRGGKVTSVSPSKDEEPSPEKK